MGFFSFVKNIGRKIAGAGKIVLGKGKSLLKTGVSIGNKVVNNPIVSRIVDIATPLLSTNPYGRAVLLGIKGAQKGLEIGDKLLEGIDTAERVTKSIQKVRGGDLSGIGEIALDVKSGIELGKNLKNDSGEFKSTVVDIKNILS